MKFLKFQAKQQDKVKDELIKEMYKLYKKEKKAQEKIKKLEKELRKFKNPNTPSSKKDFTEQAISVAKRVGRRKGKKSGHRGKTRTRDKPQAFVNVITDKNPITGNTNIAETGNVEEIIITDFKITKVVVQYNCKEYIDKDTGEIFIARHLDMPSRGIFGKNVLAFGNWLRFKCRVPFDKIASTFTTVFDMSMTTPTALDISTRVADKVSPEYQKLEKAIKKEKAVHADETGAKRNGAPGWLWGFFSLTLALFIFNKKRGGDIVERVLGKDFKGILGCDGWSTYKAFSKKFGILLQRCWAHAIREVKDICMKPKKPDKKLLHAYTWFCDIFTKVKEARKVPEFEIRQKKYEELVAELDNWISVYKSYRRLKKTVTTIENGKQFWFTCVLHLEIEPTNNRAERELRTWVVLRKIIGCLRSEMGERTTKIMLSLFSTWGLRGKNPYQELLANL